MVGQTTEVTVTTVGSPVIDMTQISGVPGIGTGLAGEVYVPGTSIKNIGTLNSVIAAQSPDLTFVATKLLYGSRHSDTSVSEFLAHDGGSLDGDGSVLEMGPSGLAFHGYVYIPPGSHTISVRSDDGFDLNLGGIDFTAYEWSRGTETTEATVDFEGGLYQMDLLYFDQGGAMTLSFEIDGFPVHPSAFYQDPQDFLNPAPGTPIVPVETYHPSYFLGVDLYDDADLTNGTDGADVIDGLGGDDTIDGGEGDDDLQGNYGNDILRGGAGNDVLDGGRGMDLLDGGEGDDLLIVRSEAGEQRIGQLAIGAPTRGDPDGEVNEARQKLAGWENQPLKSDDVLIGGDGKDTFLISPQINAKLDIIQKHVRSDGTINWAGVAGENNELHDHWVDSFGIAKIADYNANEDKIAVIGHTANVFVEHRDTDGDGDDESIVTVISKQHGGGGAHDQDLIGQVIVHGDLVTEDDIETDAGVTYGVVENYADVMEAINPAGDTKVEIINGVEVFGYDTRGPGGELGEITGDPENHIENPYLDQVVTADPIAPLSEPTRYPFEQLGEIDAPGQQINGTDTAELLMPVAPTEPAGLPGALGYWSLADGGDGSFDDARGGPQLRSHTLYENQALLRQGDLVTGPDGAPQSALHFNGDDQFGFIDHDPAYQISQGTIAIWVKPDDLADCGTFLSKDQRNTGDGGHFWLGHEDGKIFLRMAPGDGGSNRKWETKSDVLTEGVWTHLAVSFTENGVVVFADGQAISDSDWTPVEGNTASPGIYKEAYMIANAEPWVLGASMAQTRDNDTAAQFAADHDDLKVAFEGALSGFGIWGGMSPEDALTQAEIQTLITDGPGVALTNPSGPQPAVASDDVIAGNGGNDTIDGQAGDDDLDGGSGNDSIRGGYGDDKIAGGEGNDTLDGGWGSDLVVGGAGDDVLVSRADVGEDRAGQLVLGEPSRDFPDPSISDEYLKLYDWIDQPLIGDDVFVGGEGRDHFKFETLINAKFDIALEHVMSDGRMIHWGGVAGENDRIHDHWVDGIGIDIIADYVSGEDTISVIGHTTNVEVSYKSIDTDGDGTNDSVVSIITAYSQQGKNGGAHDEDYLGYIVVHGDLVNEDDIITDAGVHYGVVDTVDDLQTALAPTGESKVTTFADGTTSIGYDTRDIDGDPMGSDPEAFSSNPFLDQVTFADQTAGSSPLAVVMSHTGGTFDGTDYQEIAHSAGEQQEEGSWAFTFTAENPGNGNHQTMVSKDHHGFKDGGHLTFSIKGNGYLEVRFQSETESRHLYSRDEKIVAGQEYHVAFTFDGDQLQLFLDGELKDTDSGFADGMTGNIEDTMIGASSWVRNGEKDNPRNFFAGEVVNITVFDRPLSGAEAILLAEAGGSPAGIIIDTPIVDPVDPTPEEPVDPTPPEPEEPVLEVVGSDDAERLVGSDEAEVIDAKDGDDKVLARDGDDIVYGGLGNDRIHGGTGADEMHGGLGDDRYFIDDTGDQVIELEGEGRDTVITHISYVAAENIERVVLHHNGGDTNATGNDLGNVLRGSNGNNMLDGGLGDDRLRGKAGDDTLKGGEGNDVVVGGEGADTIILDGFGQDTFDRIRGFESGEDMLALDADVFAITGQIEDAFALTTDALSPEDVLLYDHAKGRLYYDANGDGATSDDELMAKMRAWTDLNGNDFMSV